MLLLPFLDLLEDVSHVELHASDKGNHEYECTHEVIEHFAAFFLKVDGFVLLEVVKNLVVSHRQLHHAVHLILQLFLVSLLEILQIVELLSKALHFLLLQ